MIKMQRIDLEKMFSNYRFYVGILGIAAGLCLNALEDVTNGGGRSGVENTLYGASRGGMFLLILMLSVIGGGFSYCEEQKNGNVRFVALRSGLKPYMTSKVIGAFVGGYLVTLLGQVVSIPGMMVTIFIEYNGNTAFFAGGAETINMIEAIIGLAFLGALMSVVGLTITTILPNFFVGMATPILVYYLWLSLDAWFGFPRYLTPDIYTVTQESVGIKGWWYALIYNMIFNCSVSYLLYNLCLRMTRRRVEND